MRSSAFTAAVLALSVSENAYAQSSSCGLTPSAPYQQSALQPVSPIAPVLPQVPGTSPLPTSPLVQPYISPPIISNTPSMPQQTGAAAGSTSGLPADLNTSANTIQQTLNEAFANGIDPNTWGVNYPWGIDPNDPTQYASYANSISSNVFSTGQNGLSIAIKPDNSTGKSAITGQIRTLAAQKYGYFEMTAKLPPGNGLGGAFWLLPSSGAWPPELDVMESQGENPNSVTQTMHDGTPGNVSNDQIVANVSGSQTGFHTYGMDWEADKTTFYVDGKATGSYKTPASMQQPMYAIVSMNSSPPGSQNWHATVDGTTQLPASMQVQSVKAYCLLASGCK